MKITIDGKTYTGTAEELAEVLTELEEEESAEYYHSATHGRVKISEMNTFHLRNAIIKMARESVEKAKDLTNEELAELLTNENEQYINLVMEFVSRVENEDEEEFEVEPIRIGNPFSDLFRC